MKYIFLFLIGLINIGSFAQNKINQLDEKGNKHGLWKGTYEVTHRPRYEGTFEHGKEVGVFTFYDDTSVQTVVATREFNKNDNYYLTIKGYIHADLVKIAKSDAVKNMIKEYESKKIQNFFPLEGNL